MVYPLNWKSFLGNSVSIELKFWVILDDEFLHGVIFRVCNLFFCGFGRIIFSGEFNLVVWFAQYQIHAGCFCEFVVTIFCGGVLF